LGGHFGCFAHEPDYIVLELAESAGKAEAVTVQEEISGEASGNQLATQSRRAARRIFSRSFAFFCFSAETNV
jgi:hypothetical protein